MRCFVAFAVAAASTAGTLASATTDANATTTRALEAMAVSTVQVCGMDIVGHDVGMLTISHPDYCMTNCPIVYQNQVNAASWIKINGKGTCFCKKVDANSNLNEFLVPKPGVVSFVAGRSTKGKAEMIMDMEGKMDIPGNDIKNLPAYDERVCENLCQRWDRCFAFTFTRYKGGTCWMKSKVGAVRYVNSHESYSGYAIRPWVTGRCGP